MSEELAGSALADELREARQRLLETVQSCDAEQWRAAPIDDGDPRSVGVLIDHVADSYEYILRWMRQIVDGEIPEVSPAVVDGLNAQHARVARDRQPDEVSGRLQRLGDDAVNFLAARSDEDLLLQGGRVRRLAGILISHTQNHREDVERVLTA